MSYVNPIWLEGQRQRWTRHDAHRFTKPEPIQRKTYAERLIEQRREEEEQAELAAEQDAFEREVLALRRELATLRLEYELDCFRRKYSPDQPRVPAGSPDGGQWTSGRGLVTSGMPGGSIDSGTNFDGETADRRSVGGDLIRLAGDPPVPLQRVHPDTTYQTDSKAGRSLNFWQGKPTGEIVESLKPGGKEPLITYPDGRIANGNTRVKILQERGYDVNSLPRTIHQPEPAKPLGSRGGGPLGGGFGGLPRLWPWQ